MTARPHRSDAAGCTCRRRRRRGLLAAVLTAVVALAGVPGAPAAAAWTVTGPAQQTGLIGVARPAYAFSGADDTQFQVNLTLVSGLVVSYTEFTNSGTVPATFSGTVDASPSTVRVNVASCPVAWSLGFCSQPVTTPVNNLVAGTLPTFPIAGAAAATAGQKVFLKIWASSAFTGWVRLRVTDSVLPVGNKNRTNG